MASSSSWHMSKSRKRRVCGSLNVVALISAAWSTRSWNHSYHHQHETTTKSSSDSCLILTSSSRQTREFIAAMKSSEAKSHTSNDEKWRFSQLTSKRGRRVDIITNQISIIRVQQWKREKLLSMCWSWVFPSQDLCGLQMRKTDGRWNGKRPKKSVDEVWKGDENGRKKI